MELGGLRRRAQDDPTGVRDELAAADLAGRPDAAYLLARLLARTGRAEEALARIAEAEHGFRADGREIDAWRCDAGRVDVLGNMGRHSEALQAAERYLTRLEGLDEVEPELLAGANANLGSCYELVGRDIEALERHDRAIALATAIDEVELAAVMEVNRANVLNRLGRSTAALAALTAAAATLRNAMGVGGGDQAGGSQEEQRQEEQRQGEQEGGAGTGWEAGGLGDDLAAVAVNAGETACLLGLPDEGLRWFAEARRLVRPGTLDACAIEVESAAALLALGSAEEAVHRYRQALAWLGQHPVSWMEARAWYGLGSACRLLGDREAARNAFTEAGARFTGSGDAGGAIQVRLELAALGVADGIEEARRLLDALDDDAWPVQATLVRLLLADLVEPAEAVQLLTSAVALVERTGIPHLSYRVHHRLGSVLRRQGRVDLAERHLVAALEAVDRVRRHLTSDTVLQRFPSATANVVDELVRLRLDRGDVDAAFAVADQARSRALVDLGDGPAMDQRTIDPVVRALEADLDALYDRLLGVGDQAGPEERRRLDEAARGVEARLARHRYAIPPNPGVVGTSSPPSSPDAHGAVMLYSIDGDDVGVFFRHGGETRYLPRVARLGEIVASLDGLHAAGRRALALAGSRRAGAATPGRPGGIGHGAGSADRHLARLGALVPPPVWELMVRGELPEIVVVPNGILHGVPFHALLGPDGNAVIDHTAVGLAPSLAVRARCRERAAAAGARLVVVGQPSLQLPGVGAEVAALQRLLPDPEVLIGDAATIAAVSAAMAGAGCIHLATHGIFRRGSPLQSGVRLADGWLTAERAASVGLRGATVVLSACDTGRSVVAAGDEVLGLQRGFLLAGASTVVMSLWPASDEATVDLMVGFHAHLAAGKLPAVALRSAQLEARESYPHPWWWAAFVVTGYV